MGPKFNRSWTICNLQRTSTVVGQKKIYSQQLDQWPNRNKKYWTCKSVAPPPSSCFASHVVSPTFPLVPHLQKQLGTLVGDHLNLGSNFCHEDPEFTTVEWVKKSSQGIDKQLFKWNTLNLIVQMESSVPPALWPKRHWPKARRAPAPSPRPSQRANIRARRPSALHREWQAACDSKKILEKYIGHTNNGYPADGWLLALWLTGKPELINWQPWPAILILSAIGCWLVL